MGLAFLYLALGHLNICVKLVAHTGRSAKISAAALTGANRRIGNTPHVLFDLVRDPAAITCRD